MCTRKKNTITNNLCNEKKMMISNFFSLPLRVGNGIFFILLKQLIFVLRETKTTVAR